MPTCHVVTTAAEPDAVPTEAPQAIPSSEEMEEMCYENAPDEQPMEGIKEGHNNDVLCGRGVTTNRHPGNERFRALVSANKVGIPRRKVGVVTFGLGGVLSCPLRCRGTASSVVGFSCFCREHVRTHAGTKTSRKMLGVESDLASF